MTMNTRGLLTSLTAAAAAAFLPVAMAADISGAGATFPYPIYAKWAEAYKKQTDVSLNYQSIGSGGGIKQIQAVDRDVRRIRQAARPARSSSRIGPHAMSDDHRRRRAGREPRRASSPVISRSTGPTLASIYLGEDHEVGRCRIKA